MFKNIDLSKITFKKHMAHQYNALHSINFNADGALAHQQIAGRRYLYCKTIQHWQNIHKQYCKWQNKSHLQPSMSWVLYSSYRNAKVKRRLLWMVKGNHKNLILAVSTLLQCIKSLILFSQNTNPMRRLPLRMNLTCTGDY